MSFKFVIKKMCGKRKHKSRFKARAQIIEDIKKKRYEPGDKHEYYCPFCSNWHIGGG